MASIKRIHNFNTFINTKYGLLIIKSMGAGLNNIKDEMYQYYTTHHFSKILNTDNPEEILKSYYKYDILIKRAEGYQLTKRGMKYYFKAKEKKLII